MSQVDLFALFFIGFIAGASAGVIVTLLVCAFGGAV